MKATNVIDGSRPWSIDCDDARAWLHHLPEGSIDLLFADPPFNIGYQYDQHKDRMPAAVYESFTAGWVCAAAALLKPTGTLWIAINDENVAMAHQKAHLAGLTLRNWIIWYYTFGTHQRKKFGRSKTHLLYFVKSPKEFTFNADAVRVPSKRQKIGDKRADPRGRVPPDVWKMSRLCGTFKERTGHPCQMPEKVLDRIILSTSNPGDLVADPFAGSGTTLAVAVKHGRRAIGCELSKGYCMMIKRRMK